MSRRCFYSFHYQPDATRAAQVRQIGALEGNRPATDNDWEAVKRGGDVAIKRWIAGQLQGRSCTIVLVGTGTANRKWINYEIIESWKAGMGVVGIHIHGLQDLKGMTSLRGRNPFEYLDSGSRKFSSVAECYDPPGTTSRQRYAWIVQHLPRVVEEAVTIRQRF